MKSFADFLITIGTIGIAFTVPNIIGKVSGLITGWDIIVTLAMSLLILIAGSALGILAEFEKRNLKESDNENTSHNPSDCRPD